MKESSISPKVGARLKLGYLYSGTALYQPGEVLDGRYPRLMKDFEGVLIIEGHPVYKTQYGTYALEPGSIVLARPGLNETSHWDEHHQTRHAYFHFSLEEIPRDWPDPTDWPYCQLRPDSVLAEMFHYIVDQAAQSLDWPTQQRPGNSANRLLENFLDIYLKPPVAAEEASRSEFSEPVRRSLKFMRERFEEVIFKPFSLEDLSEAANVSSKHLCRVFHNELNLSPMRVCRLMQFQLALSMLERSNRNIQDIAVRCGFPDPFYFSRSFSQTYGRSPSQLRRDMQNGSPPPPNPLPHSGSLMPRLHW
jgi:AraC-like DNA-binding protein